MNRDELIKTLQTLHQELAGAQNIDSETMKLLQTLTADIRKVLDSDAVPEPSDSDQSLSERLRETAIEFEVRHPQLGGLIERITDGLAGLGI